MLPCSWLYTLLACALLDEIRLTKDSAEEESTSGITVSGDVWNEGLPYFGAYVFLVNAEYFYPDYSISKPDGFYQLETEFEGDYWILAGDNRVSPPLASTAELGLSIEYNIVDLPLHLQAVSDDQESFVTAAIEAGLCSCEAEVWEFSYVCCGAEVEDTGLSESLSSCSWYWIHCQ